MILSASGETKYSTFVGGDGEDHRILVAPAPDGSVWAVLADTTFHAQAYSSPICNGHQPVLLRIKPGSPLFHDMVCIGGPDADAVVTDLAQGPDGSLWVLGYGSGIHTVNAWQPVSGGDRDLFVARYAGGSQNPLFATYIGGRGAEWASAMALAPDGDAVVTGSTSSPDFPLVRAAPGSLYLEGGASGYQSDAVLVRIDETGRWLEYSLRVGGTRWDSGEGLAVDETGNAYVAGYTGSPDFPVTDGTFGSTYRGGDSDAVLLSVDATGRERFAALFGGTGFDGANHLFVRPNGSVLVFGYTGSPGFETQGVLPLPWQHSQPFVAWTDSFGSTLQQIADVLLAPTRHGSRIAAVAWDPAHAYIAGDGHHWEPGSDAWEYRGHYVKKWHIGPGRHEDDGLPGQARRR
jgi:hypothetical protein